MARTVLAGTAAAVWLTSAPSNKAAPTQAELSAGTDLIGSSTAEELVEIEGFEVDPAIYPTPGYASAIVGNVKGDQTYPVSRMAFYWDDTDNTIYTALAANTVGFVVLMYDGQASGNESLLFDAETLSRVRRPARDAPHIFDVNFSISAPTEGTQAA